MKRKPLQPSSARRYVWAHRPIPAHESCPGGQSGLLLLMRHEGSGLIHLDDVYLVDYRLGDNDRPIIGYTVTKANGKKFAFDGRLPEAAAIVATVEQLDPPSPPPPLLPFRSTGDLAVNDPERYHADLGPEDAA